MSTPHRSDFCRFGGTAEQRVSRKTIASQRPFASIGMACAARIGHDDWNEAEVRAVGSDMCRMKITRTPAALAISRTFRTLSRTLSPCGSWRKMPICIS